MRRRSLFLEFVGDSPTTRVLDYLFVTEGLDFSMTDLAENAHVGRATLYRIWDDLRKHEIVIPTRVIGRARLFKLNTKNPKVKKLVEFCDALILDDLKKRVKKQEVLVTH